MPRGQFVRERSKLIGHCKACKAPMISEYAWNRYPSARPEGFRPHVAKGLCNVHYDRLQRTGHTEYVGPRRLSGPDQVLVHQCTDCGKTMVSNQYRARWPELAEKHLAMGGRGLCRRDYGIRLRNGTLPPGNSGRRPMEETLEDWEMLRDDGVTSLEVAAARMGMSLAALDQALYRARKKGDPRGSLVPFAHDMRRTAA